jgi:hypothetical protein
MVEAASSTPATATCDRCGQVYRPPQWGRAYACSACGEALGARAQTRTAIRAPRWLVGVGGVAVFAACILALSMARAKTPEGGGVSQQPATTRPLDSNAVTQPARVATRLREKIRYFEADLQLEPKNEALLMRLVYAYAALALTLRDKNRAEADVAMNRARQAERRRIQAYPQALPRVDWINEDLERLTWAAEGSGMMLPQMMTGPSTGPGFAPTPMMNAPGAGTAPGSSGGTPFAMQPKPSNAPSSSSRSNSPGSIGTPPIAFAQGPPPPQTSRDQERFLRDTLTACLAKRRQDPNDLINLDTLGTAYQRLADLEQDSRKRRLDTNLKLALEVFRDAARRSRLRIHKASFLRAAGDVYGELGDTVNEYRMAKLASEQTPFSPAVWDELQDAALRVGRFADSRTAARKAREWTLPTVQVANSTVSGPPMGTFGPPMAAPGR